ncbi:MAG: hypothetical protein QG656_2265, partial [Candidatus Hydrogenedentes bacterium]|nr:hypothetical protein [Candidatus Hydrogenedentota bacterium]
SGRWPVLGEALLRFDWVTLSVMAVCMLKLKHPAWAGGLLTYAMLSRVFPAIFFFPYCMVMLRDILKTRTIPREHIRFVVGSAAVFIVVVGATLIELGPDSFVETADNLSVHAQSYSSHRIGLGSALMYKGEKTPQEVSQHGGTVAKGKAINAMKSRLFILAFAIMGVIAVFIFRTKQPPDTLIMLSMIPLFCVTNLQSNYYNMRLLLAVGHASDLSKHRNKLGLILLFLVETVTQYVMVEGFTRYIVTSSASIAMTVYFCVMLLFLLYDIVRSWAAPEKETRKAQLKPARARA